MESLRTPVTLKKLSDSIRLVRFINLSKLQSLVGGNLWLPSLQTLANLNDPNEGSLDGNFRLFPNPRDRDADLMDYAKNNEDIQFLCKNWNENLHQARVLAWLHYLRHRRAASCWFEGPVESFPMWEAYAKNGVAVETTVGDLKNAIRYSLGDHLIDRVFYYDSGMRNLGVSPDHLRDGRVCPCFFKPRAFEGEKEIRLLGKIRHGETGRELALKKPFHEWINRIIIYPYSDFQMFREARTIVEKIVGKNFNINRIQESEIRKRSHRFEELRLEVEAMPSSPPNPPSKLDDVDLGKWPR